MLDTNDQTPREAAKLIEDIKNFKAPRRDNSRLVRSAYACHFPAIPQPKLMVMWSHVEYCSQCRERYDDLVRDFRTIREIR